ncbi:DMT family transporter [Lactococcus kimchii]|uniref:DMT family transporter n=1 Tax=Lactococcus sp. S-13 TaxID=2507158 RepID=UPI00102350AE|nr:multidrug efflux SMR transporter [Lactococcus sp. S-13]RZI49517.1 multidrug efflux SMR transporter [Lactococcus sp. S-13]
MTWFYLLLAGVFEVWWATTMKLSQGFSQLKFTLLTIVGMLASFGFLALALKKLPLGIAYPIWTGIGAVGTIFIGVLLFKDNVSPLTWVFITLLIIGIIGIKVTSGH